MIKRWEIRENTLTDNSVYILLIDGTEDSAQAIGTELSAFCGLLDEKIPPFSHVFELYNITDDSMLEKIRIKIEEISRQVVIEGDINERTKHIDLNLVSDATAFMGRLPVKKFEAEETIAEVFDEDSSVQGAKDILAQAKPNPAPSAKPLRGAQKPAFNLSGAAPVSAKRFQSAQQPQAVQAPIQQAQVAVQRPQIPVQRPVQANIPRRPQAPVQRASQAPVQRPQAPIQRASKSPAQKMPQAPVHSVQAPVQGIQAPAAMMQYPQQMMQAPAAMMQYPQQMMQAPATMMQYPQQMMQQPVTMMQYPQQMMQAPATMMQYPQQVMQAPEQIQEFPAQMMQPSVQDPDPVPTLAPKDKEEFAAKSAKPLEKRRAAHFAADFEENILEVKPAAKEEEVSPEDVFVKTSKNNTLEADKVHLSDGNFSIRQDSFQEDLNFELDPNDNLAAGDGTFINLSSAEATKLKTFREQQEPDIETMPTNPSTMGIGTLISGQYSEATSPTNKSSLKIMGITAEESPHYKPREPMIEDPYKKDILSINANNGAEIPANAAQNKFMPSAAEKQPAAAPKRQAVAEGTANNKAQSTPAVQTQMQAQPNSKMDLLKNFLNTVKDLLSNIIGKVSEMISNKRKKEAPLPLTEAVPKQQYAPVIMPENTPEEVPSKAVEGKAEQSASAAAAQQPAPEVKNPFSGLGVSKAEEISLPNTMNAAPSAQTSTTNFHSISLADNTANNVLDSSVPLNNELSAKIQVDDIFAADTICDFYADEPSASTGTQNRVENMLKNTPPASAVQTKTAPETAKPLGSFDELDGVPNILSAPAKTASAAQVNNAASIAAPKPAVASAVNNSNPMPKTQLEQKPLRVALVAQKQTRAQSSISQNRLNQDLTPAAQTAQPATAARPVLRPATAQAVQPATAARPVLRPATAQAVQPATAARPVLMPATAQAAKPATAARPVLRPATAQAAKPATAAKPVLRPATAQAAKPATAARPVLRPATAQAAKPASAAKPVLRPATAQAAKPAAAAKRVILRPKTQAVAK